MGDRCPIMEPQFPKGFRGAGVHCGIKSDKEKEDLVAGRVRIGRPSGLASTRRISVQVAAAVLLEPRPARPAATNCDSSWS